MNTFLPIKSINFGFLLIAPNFYSQRTPAWLGFIPQPSPNYVKHEWSAILTLQKRNYITETKPRFYTWIGHLFLCWIPVDIGSLRISETLRKAWNYTSYMGPLGIVPSFSMSRWNNLGSGIGSWSVKLILIRSYFQVITQMNSLVWRLTAIILLQTQELHTIAHTKIPMPVMKLLVLTLWDIQCNIRNAG